MAAKTVTAVLVGKSGSGKTKLFRNLFGDPTEVTMCPTRDTMEAELKSMSFAAVKSKEEKVKVQIIDTPGFIIQQQDTSKILKEVTVQIKTKYNIDDFDLLVYCIPLDGLYRENKVIMKSLHDFYGKNIWNKCVVVFTFSNFQISNVKQYKSCLGGITKEIQNQLHALGIDKHEANPMTIFDWKALENESSLKDIMLGIPAGFLKEDVVLPGIELGPGEGWIDEFFDQIINKISSLKHPQQAWGSTAFARLTAGVGSAVVGLTSWITREKTPTFEYQALDDEAITTTMEQREKNLHIKYRALNTSATSTTKRSKKSRSHSYKASNDAAKSTMEHTTSKKNPTTPSKHRYLYYVPVTAADTAHVATTSTDSSYVVIDTPSKTLTTHSIEVKPENISTDSSNGIVEIPPKTPTTQSIEIKPKKIENVTTTSTDSSNEIVETSSKTTTTQAKPKKTENVTTTSTDSSNGTSSKTTTTQVRPNKTENVTPILADSPYVIETPSKTPTTHNIQVKPKKTENVTATSTTSKQEFIKELKRAIDKDGKIDRKLAQVMFIGPTGSGKTSLMYRLIKRKKKKIASSTGVSDSVVPIDGFFAVTATNKTNWEEVEYDASLLRQLEADEDSGELRIKYERNVKQSIAENVQSEDSSKQSTATYDSTRQQIRTATLATARPDYSSMVEQVMKNHGGYKKFKKFFTKSYSLYMRDTGGQVEFQEMVSLLVFGPSIFIFVFKAYLDLKEKFDVEYRKSNTKSVNNYISSITMEEALLQSLASVYAMETSGGASVQTHKARVLIVATHKDKLGPNAEEKIAKLNQELQLLLTRNGFQDLVLYADKEKQQIAFTVDNTTDSDDSDFETIRSRIHGLISDRIEFNIEYPVSYLLFSLELQQEANSILSLTEFCAKAAKYGITGDQVKNLLHFLHLRIGVIQYYDIEGVRHIVIKEPQVLFNTVTNLIVGTFRGETLGEAKEIEKGILSESTLQCMIRHNDITTPKEVMKLLVHLRIAAPFTMPGEQKQYFLPCVLNHIPESTENQDKSEIMPLAIRFKCQHSPKGLFGVLVTHLMAPDPDTASVGKTTFTLLPNKLFKDQVSFKVGSHGVCDEITLKFQSTHISISFFPEKRTDRDTKKGVVCNNIRQIVYTSILKSVKNLHYDLARVEPVECLRCNHCNELHKVSNHVLYCKEKNESNQIPSQGRYWYNKDCDENAPDTKKCASNVAMPGILTAKSFPKITEYLRPLQNEEVIDVGTKLGLSFIDLKNMNHESLSLRQNMVHAWLRMDDKVTETSGKPTWESLIKALQDSGKAGIAMNIAQENGITMLQQEAQKGGETTPPTTRKITMKLHFGPLKNSSWYILLSILILLLAFIVLHIF